MNIAERVIAKFGTQHALGSELGLHQSTIAMWKKRGLIPAKYHSRLLGVAKRLSISLSPEDFFDLSSVDATAVTEAADVVGGLS